MCLSDISPVVGDKHLSETHLTEHLDYRFHGSLIGNLEGGGVHEPTEVDGRDATLEQLLRHTTCRVDEEDSGLSRGPLSTTVHLIWGEGGI